MDIRLSSQTEFTPLFRNADGDIHAPFGTLPAQIIQRRTIKRKAIADIWITAVAERRAISVEIMPDFRA
jgi:hypothetical protein